MMLDVLYRLTSDEIKEIRTCDCFIESAVILLRKLRERRGATETRIFLDYFFSKLQLEMDTVLLISTVTIICFTDALFERNHMDLVSTKELNDSCMIDLPSSRT